MITNHQRHRQTDGRHASFKLFTKCTVVVFSIRADYLISSLPVPVLESWRPPWGLREAPTPGPQRGPCPLPSAPPLTIGVGAQSTLGGTKFLHENYVLKSAKCPNFT